MAYQHTFKRYELKYMLSVDQADRLRQLMRTYMAVDRYGWTVIRNLYYDTENYRLIRHSMEKPVYKEKLRVRSYRQVSPEEQVFVELKKKYQGVVYKRRVALPEKQAMQWLSGHPEQTPDGQIGREIAYVCDFYRSLHPAVFLSYERQAWYELQGSDLRVTFDRNILFRQEALSLREPVWGTPLLPEDRVLMEVKTSGAMPLWLTGFLAEEKLPRASFSKYAAAYGNYIFPKWKGWNGYDEKSVSGNL